MHSISFSYERLTVPALSLNHCVERREAYTAIPSPTDRSGVLGILGITNIYCWWLYAANDIKEITSSSQVITKREHAFNKLLLHEVRDICKVDTRPSICSLGLKHGENIAQAFDCKTGTTSSQP